MPKSAPCSGGAGKPCTRAISGIQDRNFCTCAFLCEIDQRGAGFITRQHEGLPFEPVNVLRSVGRIETGHVAEQRVQVRDAQGGMHLFRRIRVKLDQATRDWRSGVVHPDQCTLRKASAKRSHGYIASAGRLETAFQHLEAYFHREQYVGISQGGLVRFAWFVAYTCWKAVSSVQRLRYNRATRLAEALRRGTLVRMYNTRSPSRVA